MSFNIQQFLSASIAEPISDKAPQVPKGRWLARIADLNGSGVDSWVKPPSGKATSPRLDIPYVVIDETVMREMGRNQPPTMTQGYFLNLDSASGIDTKNNAAFGQLCASLRIAASNTGELFSKLPGAGPLYITVDEDKKDPTRHRVVKTEPA